MNLRFEPWRRRVDRARSWRNVRAWHMGAVILCFMVAGGWLDWRRLREPSWQGRGVLEWLESQEKASFQCGMRDGFTSSWMEPTPELMEAMRAMGPPAMARLVEIGLARSPKKMRFEVLSWTQRHAPSVEYRLPERFRDWMRQGSEVDRLSRAVLWELRPCSMDLLPCLEHRLSNRDALLMLSSVWDEREAAANLICAQVGVEGGVVVFSLQALGPAAAAAKSGFVRYLKDNGPVGREAFRGLCELGPGAQDCLPELRAFFDRQTNSVLRIHLATMAGAADSGPFWAEPELRGELQCSNAARIAAALRILKEWPYLIPRFESDLRGVAKTGVGLMDPVDVAEVRRSEWLGSVSKQYKSLGLGKKSVLAQDLASRALDLLERCDQ